MRTPESSRLKPRVVRTLGLLVGVLLLGFVWITYLLANRSVQESFEQSTLQSVASETTLLEEQVLRSLNLTATILVTLGEITNALMISPEILTTQELRHVIANTQVIRSVSLVNANGVVVTSSNPANLGQTVDIPELINDETSLALRVNGVYFGQTLPHRDINDWSRNQTSPTQQMMPAVYPLERDGELLTWVATVNVAYFHNVWERIGHSPAVEIAVFNYDGVKLIAHHEQPIESDIYTKIAQAASVSDLGHFELTTDDNYLVVYRTNVQSPLVVASIADMTTLGLPTRKTQRFLLLMSLLATALTSIVFVTLYLLYLRQIRATNFSDRLLTGLTSHIMMIESDLEGVIGSVNPLVTDVTGYRADELIGMNMRIFNSGFESHAFFEQMWTSIAEGQIWRGTLRNKTKSGEILWLNTTIIPFNDEWGQLERYVTLYSDITDAIVLSREYEREKGIRRRLEALNNQLKSEATSDPLTGLANRRRLDDFLLGIRQQADLSGTSLSVLLMDLDHFKQVNDRWGHAAGDEVLREMTKLWSQLIRSSDLLVRIGGEEFALLLPRTSKDQAKQVAEKLRTHTSATAIHVTGANEPIRQTISIGIAFSKDIEKESIDELLARADKALYRAKRGGRDQTIVLDSNH